MMTNKPNPAVKTASITPNPANQPIETYGPVGLWSSPVTVAPNNFVYKSLSNWAVNTAVGCSHACRFCYVPSAATIKQKPKLAHYGVSDPDAEWGNYVLIRPWNERKFQASLSKAENTPVSNLKPDGNRAVFYCSTTDPYQVIHHHDRQQRQDLDRQARSVLRKSLEVIRDHSTLNVRILTRSPLASTDFELFRSFGNRLLFGMSLPTLNNTLAKVYEPKAPSPSKRFETLKAAREAGLNIYVAIAPTYPECDSEDLYRTLAAIGPLQPVTIFHEPINIRAENVTRIQSQADTLGLTLNTDVFSSRQAWVQYAINALKDTEAIANDLGLAQRLHLWPDKSLGSKAVLSRVHSPEKHMAWLNKYWQRISEWPAG